MAKKRKTRQEKIIADLRRQLQTQELPQSSAVTSVASTYSLPQAKPIVRTSTPNYSRQWRDPAAAEQLPISNVARQGASSTHSYVLSDLKKTLLFTILAIAAQVGLYFVLLR